MPKQQNNLPLTNREVDILNILWNADKPLIASEIVKFDDTLTINTVQSVLKKLMNKKLIEVSDIVYSGTVLCRSYKPTVDSKEFTLNQFVTQFQNSQKNLKLPIFISAMLEIEEDEEATIQELEKLLEERKKQLNDKER